MYLGRWYDRPGLDDLVVYDQPGGGRLQVLSSVGQDHLDTTNTLVTNRFGWFRVVVPSDVFRFEYQVYAGPVWRYAVLWHSDNTN